jgi:hypothetical protein
MARASSEILSNSLNGLCKLSGSGIYSLVLYSISMSVAISSNGTGQLRDTKVDNHDLYIPARCLRTTMNGPRGFVQVTAPGTATCESQPEVEGQKLKNFS